MSEVMLHPVLADLESRAGASDADRPAWLRERRGGITATEVRDLMRNGPAFRAELIKQKLSDEDMVDLSSIPVIGWGRLREPVIAEIVRQRYAIAPESRVFRAADHPGFLASPDGVGIDFADELIVSEIKTTGHPKPPDSEAFERAGYLDQMLWSMRVSGARRCLYVWEERLDDGHGGFVAGELHFHWIEYDEVRVRALEATAIDFLDELEDQRINGPQAIDEDLDTHAVNYLRFIQEEKSAATGKKSEYDAMIEVLSTRGGTFRQASTMARISFTPGVEKSGEMPDVEAAKLADPALFAEVQELSKRWNAHQAKFMKSVTSTSKPMLRVTEAKESK